MGPIGHTAVSAGVGVGIWVTTGAEAAVPAALAAGVLPDVDHLWDYYNWYVRRDRRNLFLVFHAWEYAAVVLPLALAMWPHPVLVAAALGYVSHLAGDQVMNRPTPKAMYLILYRASVGFEGGQTPHRQPDTFFRYFAQAYPDVESGRVDFAPLVVLVP